MTISARALADSVSPRGIRLTTIEATYPRIVHAEAMTHRVLSRNSASTRAIPLYIQLRNLLENPFIPERFGINQAGMQAYEHLAGLKHDEAVEVWLAGRDRAVTTVLELSLGTEVAAEILGYEPDREYVHAETILAHFDELTTQMRRYTQDGFDLGETTLLNVHKQLAGRGLEAYMYHTVIFTATEWDNMFALRIHPEAQGEINQAVTAMKQAIDSSTPVELAEGEWHLPLVDPDEDGDMETLLKLSVARCAAASYNRQSARNPTKEIERYDGLRGDGHMSPFEHQATPFTRDEQRVRDQMRLVATRTGLVNELRQSQLEQLTEFSGNFRGWNPHRKDISGEDVFSKIT